MTYKASIDGLDWRPAIHGHLDSAHHRREQGYFDFASSDDVYFPLEHSRFMTDQFPVLDKGINAVHLALLEIQLGSHTHNGLTQMKSQRAAGPGHRGCNVRLQVPKQLFRPYTLQAKLLSTGAHPLNDGEEA